ncbi:unnamed protein product, partial [Musa hybrid cultivar]
PDERGVDRPFPAQQDLRSLKFFKGNGDPRKKNSSLGLKWILDEYHLHPNFFEMICSSETEEIILCRIQHKGRTRVATTASQPRSHLCKIPKKHRSHGGRDLPPGN